MIFNINVSSLVLKYNYTVFYLILTMGQKRHPIAIRLGLTQKSYMHWYATGSKYSFFSNEDQHLHNYVFTSCRNTIISKIEIERRNLGIRLRIFAVQLTSLVGHKQRQLKQLYQKLQSTCKRYRYNYFQYSGIECIRDLIKNTELHLFVQQVNCPAADAQCLAEYITVELEKRTPFRRLLRKVQERVHNLSLIGGFRVQLSGRLNGAEIARIESTRSRDGRVPLQTFSTKLGYSSVRAKTTHGLLGVKV
jgi:small subunit ribosomal protein S3